MGSAESTVERFLILRSWPPSSSHSCRPINAHVFILWINKCLWLEVPETTAMVMMEWSAKTSSSAQSVFLSAAHFLPNSTACRWIIPRQLAGVNFNLNKTIGNAEILKVPMFEKLLTPSDVGKLNRLVIPKQHAEKYFPLNGGADSGRLRNFEDEAGRSWKFRYSYWSSSQSYVLTKGWSRFVKEKKLDAGDIVVFERHSAEAGRFFIGCRRRHSGGGNPNQGTPSLPHQPDSNRQAAGSSLHRQRSSACGNSKRLRLFGVTLECLADDSDSVPLVPLPVQHLYHQYFSHHMASQ